MSQGTRLDRVVPTPAFPPYRAGPGCLRLLFSPVNSARSWSSRHNSAEAFAGCAHLLEDTLKKVRPFLRNRRDLQERVDAALNEASTYAEVHRRAWALRDVVVSLIDVLQPNSRARLALHDHDGEVTSVVFAPHGRTFASAGVDGRVAVYESVTGRVVCRPSAVRNGVYALAFSPDGKLLAAARTDGSTRLYDISNGYEVANLKGHRDAIAAVAFSPDGKLLVSGGYDKEIIFWDWKVGKETLRCHALNGRVTSLAFSPNGTRVVSGGTAGTRLTLPGGNVFVSGFADSICLWDCVSGKRLREFQSRGSILAFSPDGREIAAGGLIPDVRVEAGRVSVDGVDSFSLLSTAGRTELLRIPWHGGAIAYSADGRMLASARGSHLHLQGWGIAAGNGINGLNLDTRLRLWEVATATAVRRFRERAATVVALSPNGSILAAGTKDGRVFSWDLIEIAKDHAIQAGSATDDQLNALWLLLASDDTVRAHQAVCTLAATHNKAIELIRKRVVPVPDCEGKRIRKLLSDLDSTQPMVRAAAYSALSELGDQIKPVLVRTVQDSTSPEVVAKAQSLLATLATKPSSRHLQETRAIQVLELIGSEHSILLLEQLAKGAKETSLTEEARTSLERLARCKSIAP
jgi:WD40 repeat protein